MSKENLSLRGFREDFNEGIRNINFQSLRQPINHLASLEERPGFLRLYGKESLSSLHEQALLACRQQDFGVDAVTRLEFDPLNFQQMAGLVYYYDTLSHYYLYISRDETEGKVLSLLTSELGNQCQPLGMGVKIPDQGSVWLKLSIRKETSQFSYSLDGINFTEVGAALAATVLSDDYYWKIKESRFTGAFLGICCQDLSGRGAYADFDYFEYQAVQ